MRNIKNPSRGRYWLCLKIALWLGCHGAQQPPAQAQPPPLRPKDTCTVYLGSEAVRLFHYQQGEPSGLYFVALHDNENTCVEAILPILQANYGHFVELRARNKRFLDFRHQGKAYFADPNRIFSADSTAVIYNAFALSPQQVRMRSRELYAVHREAVRPFAEALENSFRPAGLVVSLHNNFHTSDAGSYNLTWYLNGGKEQAQARAIYCNPKRSNSDFFVVTDTFFFVAFQERGFNVVLQESKPQDDGSLSVFCAKKGIPYINIEVKHGRDQEQREMILAVYAVLRAYDYQPKRR